MSRIANPKGPLGIKTPKVRGTTYEAKYYAWLHSEGSCVVTAYTPFEIAHTGGLSEGKGMGAKSWLQTCLPLRKELHVIEESNRTRFWHTVGLPDYLEIAADLFEAFKAGRGPGWVLFQAQSRIDVDCVRNLLGEMDF